MKTSADSAVVYSLCDVTNQMTAVEQPAVYVSCGELRLPFVQFSV